MMEDLASKLGYKQDHSSSYYPRVNGFRERERECEIDKDCGLEVSGSKRDMGGYGSRERDIGG